MRYAFNNDIDVHSTLSTDVLIVGAGIAGLYTALAHCQGEVRIGPQQGEH